MNKVHNEKAEIFHNIKLRENFFHMVQKGAPKDLERIQNILEKDPSKYFVFSILKIII